MEIDRGNHDDKLYQNMRCHNCCLVDAAKEEGDFSLEAKEACMLEFFIWTLDSRK